MDKPKRIKTIKIFNNDRLLLSDIEIVKYKDESLYTIYDYISGNINKIPYVIVSNFILYMSYLKDFTDINVIISD